MLTASTDFTADQSFFAEDRANLLPDTFATQNELGRDRISLTQWLQGLISPGWHDRSNLDLQVGVATRGSAYKYEISDTIEKLKYSGDENYRQELIKKLGFIANGDQDAVQSLVELIETTHDDLTLWTAVDSLRQAAPSHPAAGTSRSKSIDLCHTFDFNFVVKIVPKLVNRVGVLLQVYPDSANLYLPNGLKLILQDEAGNTLREVVSVNRDYCIQLKLSGTYREIFSVCLELDGIVSIADFVI